ncbi:chemotaxis protein CheB [Variovorax saccharolyticus]|uniref:chemotaxis protein CheB n=1 Tax=Variovorax saccharolyticus TaxID=3053516 RepID=UPI0025764E99|nr:chemotaxis protein CheB [Variovorax sp. J22R187]
MHDGAEARRSSLQFPVVGIGASAGGSAAALKLFEHMTEEPGMAFVVCCIYRPRTRARLIRSFNGLHEAHVIMMLDGQRERLEPDSHRLRCLAKSDTGP